MHDGQKYRFVHKKGTQKRSKWIMVVAENWRVIFVRCKNRAQTFCTLILPSCLISAYMYIFHFTHSLPLTLWKVLLVFPLI